MSRFVGVDDVVSAKEVFGGGTLSPVPRRASKLSTGFAAAAAVAAVSIFDGPAHGAIETSVGTAAVSISDPGFGARAGAASIGQPEEFAFSLHPDAMERHWERAMGLLRERGEDVDEVLTAATETLRERNASRDVVLWTEASLARDEPS